MNRISKVKYDGKKVRIEYERERPDGDPDEFVLSCGDTPSVSFVSALQALALDLNAICEFSPAIDVTVRGVSLSWSNDIMGACVTALRSLKSANSPLVITTPHLPESDYSPTGSGPIMPAGMADRLRALIDQADAYINGSARAQQHLFAETDSTLQPA